jgi:hypothetical protein
MTKQYWVKLGEQVVTVALAAFLGSLIAGDWFSVHGIVQVSLLAKAGLAAAAAALTFVKGVAASFFGDTSSPNFLR